MNTCLIAEMTWQEYQSRIKDGVLIIPVGSTEQHAPHSPLGVDIYLAEKFSIQLAQRIGALVAPTINYGYKSQPKSGGGPLFPGTIDLNGSTLINLMQDILKEFLADGWQKILVLNAHFENQPFLIEGADLVLRDQKEAFPKVIITSWYDNISEELIPEIFNEVPFAGWELEHAALVETSAMLYYRPELVHQEHIIDEGLDKVPTYSTFPPDPNLIPASGSLHTARSSSAQKGQLMVEDALKNIEKILEKEFII